MITSSTFAVGPPQIDGRVWITETHTDDVAGPLVFAYLAADASNAQAVMTARAVQIAADLAAQEIAEVLGGA